MAKTRLYGLDGLRGVCALSVMLMHCELLFNAGVFFCHGYLAVDMFFILSGFVIAGSYDARLAAGLTARQFLMARMRRLAPVYWGGLLLCVGAALLITLGVRPPQAGRILREGAMAFALIPGSGPQAYPANSVAWTLAWELMVNLIYAKWLRQLSSGALAAVIAAALLGAGAESLLGPDGWDFGMHGGDFWLGGLRTLPEFLIGVLLLRGYRTGLFDRLPAMTPFLPLAAWLAIATLPNGIPPLLDAMLAVLACPLLLALLVRGELVAPRWFALAGALSYPLYASHLGLVWLAQRTPLFGLEHGPDPIKGVLVVVTALGCAWVIYRLFDPAARKAGGFGGIPPKKPVSGACATAPEPV